MMQWAMTSSILILLILALRALLKDRVSARLRYALWLVVAVRLLVPFQTPELGLPAAVDLAPQLSPRWESPRYQVDEIPIAEVEASPDSPFHIQENGVVATSDSFGFPELDDEAGVIRVYADFWSPKQIALTVWGAGAAVVLLAMLISNFRFSRSLRKNRRPLEVSDVPLPMYVYVAQSLPSPCLFGLMPTAIYVTPEAAADETALRHVLAHELTHYAHLDHLWSPLRCLCLSLHWYNPLVWLAVFLSKRDGELACDEGAVKRLGEEERLSYGRTLVDMVAQRGSRPADLFSCSTAMTGGKKSIQQRVALLVKRPETKKAALFLAVAAVALAAVFVFSGGERQNSKTLYHQFLEQVQNTQSIKIELPLYFSAVYPDPIADEDLMTKAREHLSQALEMKRFEKPKWSDISSKGYTITLFQNDEDAGINYVLYRPYNGVTSDPNDMDYILIWNGTVPDYIPVAALPPAESEELLTLLHTQQNRNSEQTVPLSGQELLAFNQEFLSEGGTNIHNQFLTSLYDRPEDIDLYELFYLGDGSTEEMTEEERRAVFGNYGEEGPDCGCDKLTRAGMEQVLSEHMELTLEQTNQVGLENFLYLPQYDAYYHPHGDTNYYANVNFHSGFRQGDQIFLYYNDEFMGRGPCKLTMRETEQHHYLFVANQQLPS